MPQTHDRSEAVPLGFDRSKLRPPRRPVSLLTRERLLQHFSSESIRPLTLLIAPAGFGKTSLQIAAYEQLIDAGRLAVWLSLGEEDRDPAFFLEALLTALSRSLDCAAEPPVQSDSVLRNARRLINAICAQPQTIQVFLEHYERASSAELNDLLMHLLERLGGQLCITLATRTRPALPLGRLRAAGSMREIGKSELRFTAEECAQLLAKRCGTGLSSRAVSSVHTQTHGWAAALQLATLAIEEGGDRERSALAFTLRSRAVAEYIETELLARLSEPQRRVLTCASYLNQVSTSLCVAVTADESAGELLEQLCEQDLYFDRSDAEGNWYRLDPALRDYIQGASKQSEDEVRSIHRRAYHWYASHNLTTDAVEHSARAQDFERMAELVESCRQEIMMQGHVRTLDGWLNQLPRSLIAERPHLKLTKCWILLWRRDCVRAKVLLDSVESDLQSGLLDRLCTPEPVRALLQSNMTATRHVLAFYADDWSELSRIAGEDREPSTPPDSSDSGVIYNIRAYCYYVMGRYDAAIRAAAVAHPIHERHGNVSGRIFLDSFIGLAHFEQLHMDDALSHLGNAFRLASERCAGTRVISSLPAVLLAQLHYERDELEEANRYLNVAALNTDELSMVESIIISAYVGSSIEFAEGHRERALEILARAEAHGREGKFERLIGSILCIRLRLLLRAGDHTAAAEVITEISALLARYAAMENVGRPRTIFELTCAQARWRIATQAYKQALELLEPLAAAIRKKNQRVKLVRVLTLCAAAKQGLGRAEAASMFLGEAFRLAGASQLRRVFIDEMYLIREVLEHTIANFDELKAHKLGFGDSESLMRFMQRAGIALADNTRTELSRADQIEPLSRREQNVLTALALGKSNRRIAESLGIAESTVAWHMKSILKKMWVTTRAEAIAKATRLGIGAPRN